MRLRETKFFYFCPLHLLFELGYLLVSRLQLVLRLEQLKFYVLEFVCGNCVYLNILWATLLEHSLQISNLVFELSLDIVCMLLAFFAVCE